MPPAAGAPMLFPLLFFFFTSAAAAVATVSFDSSTFSFASLSFLGDSFLRNGSIGLTRETAVPSSSAGAVVCNLPFQLYDPAANSTASFSARFSFTVGSASSDVYGDGLTFFLSPTNSTLGAAGAFLGVFNSSSAGNSSAPVIAVEFDTRQDSAFGDPSDNHVGVDIAGPSSAVTADLTPFSILLKSGNATTAWVDYDGAAAVLNVSVSSTGTKPDKPALTAALDLGTHFKELIYVGFSASTEGSTELHTITSWTFRTFGLNSSGDVGADLAAGSSSQPPPMWFVLWIIGPVALFAAIALLAWTTIRRPAGRPAPELLKGPRSFTYKELSAATRGFHPSRVIGKGAFGVVYRASPSFAVKRSARSHQSRTEFASELSIIAGLRHKNLLRLEGYCDERGELLLVYEFMPNGSLDRALHGGRSPPLSWPHRCNVVAGVASALAYLHQECEQRVIHRDIKTSNILLDANLSPRLGDFGLARLIDHGASSPVSTLTAGTMGYLAPEYLQSGKATDKTDVFSFGVVVLEVCCGRRPIEKDNLVDWVWKLYSEDRLLEAADSRMNGEFDGEGMHRLLLVGLSCANPKCSDRPTMRRVVQILRHEAEPVPVPRKKPLLVFSSSRSIKIAFDEDCTLSGPPSPSCDGESGRAAANLVSISPN